MIDASSQTVFVRGLTLADLPGTLTKLLEVPPGHTGLVVDGQGTMRTFPPGTHWAVGPGRRLFGRLSDWQFALVPTEAVSLIVPVTHVRAGDGEWVDVTCGAVVRVADPQRFYSEFRAAIDGSTTDLARRLGAGIDGVVRQAVGTWAARDLVKGAVEGQLAAEVRRALSTVADTLGLEAVTMRYVVARPAAEAVDVARQQAELEAALDDVELERRMSQLATEAEFKEFVEHLEADYGLPAGTLQVELEGVSADEEGDSAPLDLAGLRQAARRHFDSRIAGLASRVERLLGARERPDPPPLRWWERAVPWFKAASAILAVAALLAFILRSEVSPLERSQAIVQLAVALPAAVALFLSALWLERKAARQRADAFDGPGLLDLGRGDWERIDRLVRKQMTTELADVVHKLRDTRDRAYRQGKRDQALAIKRSEERADRLRERVAARAEGVAAYLTEAHVARQALETKLNYDEELLAAVSDLSNSVQAFRQHALAGALGDDELHQIEGALTALDHQFQARARFIQAPAIETNTGGR